MKYSNALNRRYLMHIAHDCSVMFEEILFNLCTLYKNVREIQIPFLNTPFAIIYIYYRDKATRINVFTDLSSV